MTGFLVRIHAHIPLFKCECKEWIRGYASNLRPPKELLINDSFIDFCHGTDMCQPQFKKNEFGMMQAIIHTLFSALIVFSASVGSASERIIDSEESALSSIPKADLALSPYEGTTVFCEPSKILWGTYLSYGGLKKFPYEGSSERHITLSTYSDPRDCFEVVRGLYAFNLEKLGITGHLDRMTLELSGLPADFIELERHSGSLSLNTSLLTKCTHGSFPNLLKKILASAPNQKAERVRSIAPIEQLEIKETLLTQGFRIVNTVDCSQVSKPSILMMKDLEAGDPTELDSQ